MRETASPTLHLHEELLLLALRDEEGTLHSSTHYPFALGGALLAELLLGRRVEVEESKRRAWVRLRDASPLGESLLDECLAKVRDAKRPLVVRTWVSKFANLDRLRHRVAEGLCRRRILRAEEGKILALFSRTTYPTVDPRPERRVVDRLRRAVFGEARTLDPRTVVLVSLADRTGILARVFDRKELKRRRARIREIENGEVVGKATEEVIRAMQAAVTMVCILPAITSH